MRFGAAIPHAFRHRVRLAPDYVLPEIPAIGAEGEGEHPRDAQQVFVLRLSEIASLPHRSSLRHLDIERIVEPAFVEACLRAARARGVAVADVEPERAVVA